MCSKAKRPRREKRRFPPEILSEIFFSCDSTDDWRNIRQISPRMKHFVNCALISEIKLRYYGPEESSLQFVYNINCRPFTQNKLTIPSDTFASAWNNLKNIFIYPFSCQSLSVKLFEQSEEVLTTRLKLLNDAPERFFKKMEKLKLKVRGVHQGTPLSKEISVQVQKLFYRAMSPDLKCTVKCTLDDEVAEQMLKTMIFAEIPRIEFRASAEVARLALREMTDNFKTNLTLLIPQSQGSSDIIRDEVKALCKKWSSTPILHRNQVIIEGASADLAMAIPYRSMHFVQMVAEYEDDAITIKFSLLPQIIRVSHKRAYNVKITAKSRIGVLPQRSLGLVVLNPKDVYSIESLAAAVDEHYVQFTICPLPSVEDENSFLMSAGWSCQSAVFQTSNIHKFTEVDEFSVEGFPAAFKLD